eukprot:TRINITY_DN1972_c0_g2_i1.p1 TRINITY_DN1972_c0_g2~~TRINITY_DN1972_c0_g2_i1.p1  ORF type:complete len:157 (-),score=22.83 TRINITY_DN1972_c0_g2_i1:233-703(-)
MNTMKSTPPDPSTGPTSLPVTHGHALLETKDIPVILTMDTNQPCTSKATFLKEVASHKLNVLLTAFGFSIISLPILILFAYCWLNFEERLSVDDRWGALPFGAGYMTLAGLSTVLGVSNSLVFTPYVLFRVNTTKFTKTVLMSILVTTFGFMWVIW